jgi:hypothetical protein
MWAVPRLVSFTLAFALQLTKITEILRVAEEVPVVTFWGRYLAQMSAKLSK